jgi:hypothetical protein
MTNKIPTLAAALLMTAIATPVFAQAAVQEPGAYSFYHPDADVLNAGRFYRPLDANAYFNEAAQAPRVQHHRATRRAR